MTASSVPSPDTILGNYRLPNHPLYLVGVFARGVTVYSQQIRAFNLTWALVEQRILNCKLKEDASDTGKLASLAIIGGGFAGLTAAAALIKKGVHAEITIFEQRDTLVAAILAAVTAKAATGNRAALRLKALYVDRKRRP
jgi:NADPH-dependent 2,4-dienoyl-CoA reductase/sulfur reductase-like enzyme